MKMFWYVVLSKDNRISETAFTPEAEDDGVKKSGKLGLKTEWILGRKVESRSVFQYYHLLQGWVSVNSTLSNAEHLLSRDDNLFPVLSDTIYRIVECVEIRDVDAATPQHQCFVGGGFQLSINNI